MQICRRKILKIKAAGINCALKCNCQMTLNIWPVDVSCYQRGKVTHTGWVVRDLLCHKAHTVG